MDQFKETAEFNNGHPSWQKEIQESVTPLMLNKLKAISTDLGILGVLIYIRLATFLEMSNSALSD
jgi:hypothetical protein